MMSLRCCKQTIKRRSTNKAVTHILEIILVVINRDDGVLDLVLLLKNRRRLMLRNNLRRYLRRA